MTVLETRRPGFDANLTLDEETETPSPDKPMRPARTLPGAPWELIGSAFAAVALVSLVFGVVGSHPWVGMAICAVVAFLVLYGVVTRLLHGADITKDRLGAIYVWVGGIIALFPLLQIVWTVTARGAPVVFSHFPKFLTNDAVLGGAAEPVWDSGVGHAIVGTAEQVGIATLLSVPVALLTAVYLSESKSRAAPVLRLIVDAMMGTPSIVAGLFVYLFWVQPRGVAGFSGFACSIALAILMLPLMIRTAEEVIRVVPGSLREAGYALGAPNWRVTLRVVLPTVRTGLITAVILGIALAVGETAPALFTAKGSEYYNFNAFHGVQADLPLQVFTNIRSSSNTLRAEGYGGAFVLVFLVLSLFVVARIVGSGTSVRRRIFRRRRSKEVPAP